MKKLFLLLAAALCMSVASADQAVMLSAVTTTGAGAGITGSPPGLFIPTKTYQVTGQTTASTGSAVVAIEGSNDLANWDVIGTVTLTLGTTTTSGSFTSADRYVQVRSNVTTLTGTGAAVSATMGY